MVDKNGTSEKNRPKALIIQRVSQRSELFCVCKEDTDIYQRNGAIVCVKCGEAIKTQNCG